jgi:hypothetical protein
LYHEMIESGVISLKDKTSKVYDMLSWCQYLEEFREGHKISLDDQHYGNCILSSEWTEEAKKCW